MFGHIPPYLPSPIPTAGLPGRTYIIQLRYEEMEIDDASGTAVAVGRGVQLAIDVALEQHAIPARATPSLVAEAMRGALSPSYVENTADGITHRPIRLMIARVREIADAASDADSRRHLALYESWLYAIDHALTRRMPPPPCPSIRSALEPQSHRAIAAAVLVSMARAGTQRIDMKLTNDEHVLVRMITGSLTPPKRMTVLTSPTGTAASREVTLDDLEDIFADPVPAADPGPIEVPVLWRSCWAIATRVVAAVMLERYENHLIPRQMYARMWATSHGPDWSPTALEAYVPGARDVCKDETRLILCARYAVLRYIAQSMPDLRDTIGAMSASYYFQQLVQSADEDLAWSLNPDQIQHPSQFVTYMDSHVLPRRFWDAITAVLERYGDSSDEQALEMEFLSTRFDAAFFAHTHTKATGAVELALIDVDACDSREQHRAAAHVIRRLYSAAAAQRVQLLAVSSDAGMRDVVSRVPARCAPFALVNYTVAAAAIVSLAEERGLSLSDPDEMLRHVRTLMAAFYQSVMGNPQFSGALRRMRTANPRLFCILGAVARSATRAWSTCVFNVLPRQWTENQMAMVVIACKLAPDANDYYMLRSVCWCGTCTRVLTPLASTTSVVEANLANPKRVRYTGTVIGMSRTAVDIFSARARADDVFPPRCRGLHGVGTRPVYTEDIIGKVFKHNHQAYVRCANAACSRTFRIEPFYSQTNYAGLICAQCAVVLHEKRDSTSNRLKAGGVDLTTPTTQIVAASTTAGV